MNNFNNIIQEAINNTLKRKLNESEENNYTHLAVNKYTNLIVNGWDYSDVEPDELRQFKNDYFMVDLKDYGFNPKAYKILTTRMAEKKGATQWSNTGVFPLEEENKMQKEGQNPFELAEKEHPDWFYEDMTESKKHINEALSPDFQKALIDILEKAFSNLSENEKIFLHEIANQVPWDLIYAMMGVLK